MFRDMTIGKKIGTAMGLVLFILAGVAIWSTFGIHGIIDSLRGTVTNAQEVIYGNKLRGEIIQKEVDHLNWANKVNELLTNDKVTNLNVQTDHTKCAFGKWLYSEERTKAEKKVPQLKEIFAAIEEPHKHLHESAMKIRNVFRQADLKLPAFLAEKEIDHLKWMAKVQDIFVKNMDELNVQTDHHLCGFGKFIYGESGRKMAESDAQLAQLLEEIKEPHKRLHASAITIKKIWRKRHEGLSGMLKDRLEDHHKWIGEVSRALAMQKKKLNVQKDPALCEFGKFLKSKKAAEYAKEIPELERILDACRKPHDVLHKSAEKIDSLIRKTVANNANPGQTSSSFKQAIAVFENETMPAMEEVAAHIQEAIKEESRLLDAQQRAHQILETETAPALEDTRAILAKMKLRAEEMVKGMEAANRIYATHTKPQLETVQGLLKKINKTASENIMTDEQMLASAKDGENKGMRTQTSVGVGSIIAIIFGIALSFFISRGIISSLKRIITGLTSGSEQTASASGEISSASQSLAEGATEQAASLEETSSALEEMASMTRQNADNANVAKEMMDTTQENVSTGSNAVDDMSKAMSEINGSSEEIGNIIKTIEEIAFQTNLLALNAAVEAARAGDAGKGFAVVADEVRNLAQRSAQAARDTADLIEGTVAKVKNGAEIVKNLQTSFSKVEESTAKANNLISEITSASNEQAQGIDQVNTAVAQMDKVTQQNAANAEESASASEELSAQAEQLNDMVHELSRMVGGSSNGQFSRTQRLERPARIASKTQSGTNSGQAIKRKELGTPRHEEAAIVRPNDIIPLDDDDFGEF